jgi:glycosyltransferase involved in cell wall biosynthesis
MNVTTSNNWRGNPVGITRVESEIRRRIIHTPFVLDHYGFETFSGIQDEKKEKPLNHIVTEQKVLNKASGFVLNAKLLPRANRIGKGVGYITAAMYGDNRSINRVLDTFVHKGYEVFKRLRVLDTFVHKGYEVSKRLAQSMNKKKTVRTTHTLLEFQHSSDVYKAAKSPFSDGDIILTCGLDWDYSFLEKFKIISNYQDLSLVTVVYDMIPILNPEYIQDSRYVNRLLGHFTLIAELSSLVLLNTLETEIRFKEFCQTLGIEPPPTRIVPWGVGIDDSIVSSEVSDVLANVKEKGFLLAVGTLEIRKNYELLLRIVQLAHERDQEIPHFVFVGMPGWGTTDLTKQLKSNEKLEKSITWLTDVDDRQLKWLYENCEGLLSPSFSEGYGLPVGEAKLFSKPTFLSDIAVYRELFPDSIFISPNDPAAWLEVIANPTNYLPSVEKPKNWDQATIEIARSVGEVFNVKINYRDLSNNP